MYKAPADPESKFSMLVDQCFERSTARLVLSLSLKYFDNARHPGFLRIRAARKFSRWRIFPKDLLSHA